MPSSRGRCPRPRAALAASRAKPGAASAARSQQNSLDRLGSPGSGRQRERRDAPGDLAADPQRLAAGGQDRAGRARAQQPLGQRRARRRSGARSCRARAARARSPSRAASSVDGSRARALLHAERGRPPRRARAPGPATGASSTSHTPSAKPSARPRGQLERQPRLAAAAGPGERQQPRVVERSAELAQLALAADEARQLVREARTPRGGGRRAPALARPGSRGRAGGSRDPGRPRARARSARRSCWYCASACWRRPAAAKRRISAAVGRPRAAGPRPPRAGASRSPRRRPGPLQVGELDEQREVQLAQRLAPRRRPVLVAVLGQQLAARRGRAPSR